MSFRFRKSLRIVPRVHLNLSKGGPSLSFGPRGATTSISRRGVRQTVSLPGTGLSHSKQLSPAHARPHRRAYHPIAVIFLATGMFFWVFGSMHAAVLLILAAIILALF